MFSLTFIKQIGFYPNHSYPDGLHSMYIVKLNNSSVKKIPLFANSMLKRVLAFLGVPNQSVLNDAHDTRVMGRIMIAGVKSKLQYICIW